MKRFAAFLFAAIICCFLLSASGELLLRDNTNELSVRGFIRKYCMVKVYPINASGSASFGLPFNLLGDDVSYHEDTINHGRIIATWIMASNYDQRTLTVTAAPLVFEPGPNDDPNLSASINYKLILRYAFQSQNLDGSFSTTVRNAVVESNNVATQIDISNVTSLGQNMPILATDSNEIIKLMLADYTTEQKNAWPNGNYSADVYFSIIGGD